MKLIDIIILISVILVMGLIILFQFILPKITKKNPCFKCAYASKCSKINTGEACGNIDKSEK